MGCIRLDKRVLEFTGGAREFLNGITTNRMEAPQNAFVDVKGRIVATFDQALIGRDTYAVVMEAPFLERVKRHLEKYLALSETTVREKALQVYFDSEGVYKAGPGGFEVPQKKGSLIATPGRLKESWTMDEFTLFRLMNAIPFQGIDFDEEMLLNVDEMTYVSYDKGCYLGQEIIARVHFRSRPPKKLVVKAEEDLTPDERRRMTSRMKDPVSGKVFGFVFVSHGNS